MIGWLFCCYWFLVYSTTTKNHILSRRSSSIFIVVGTSIRLLFSFFYEPMLNTCEKIDPSLGIVFYFCVKRKRFTFFFSKQINKQTISKTWGSVAIDFQGRRQETVLSALRNDNAIFCFLFIG